MKKQWYWASLSSRDKEGKSAFQPINLCCINASQSGRAGDLPESRARSGIKDNDIIFSVTTSQLMVFQAYILCWISLSRIF